MMIKIFMNLRFKFKIFKEFSKHKLYELTTNYRSKNNIVNYTSKFILNSDRLKQNRKVLYK